MIASVMEHCHFKNIIGFEALFCKLNLNVLLWFLMFDAATEMRRIIN
jgi:hypothetical protein